MAEFTRKFQMAINDCLSNPDSPDSHVLETISGRGTLYQIIHLAELRRKMEAVISETTWNKELIYDIYQQIDENIKNPEKVEFLTTRLRFSALELLLTSRYLEEDPAFYKKFETCFHWISAVNEKLINWHQSRRSVEKWFLKDKKSL